MITILRVSQDFQSNQTGVENKHFKKEQMIEVFLEPKTWLFFIFSIVDNIPNSLTNQGTIIITSFGFTTLQTTLLGCVSGVIEIATIWSGVEISSRIPNSRAYVGAVYFLPSLLGVFLVNLLPWSDQVGLLFSVWLGTIQITAFGMLTARFTATPFLWTSSASYVPCMGFGDDFRTHEESHNECSDALWILHW